MKSLSDCLYAAGLALTLGGLVNESKGAGLLGVLALVASGVVEAVDRHHAGDRRLTPREAAAVLLASLDDDR